MATTRSETSVPGRLPSALAGFVSAGVALSIGHLVAALFNPAASPVVVVGSQLMDAAPTPVKEVAVRLLVPGVFGFVSATKWLNRIEFTTYAKKQAYWTQRDWATDAPILTQARIDVPQSLGTLPKGKPVLAGVAWAQNRGIKTVEVRIDGGEWIETKLADDAGVDLWRQWSHVYDGPAGGHTGRRFLR